MELITIFCKFGENNKSIHNLLMDLKSGHMKIRRVLVRCVKEKGYCGLKFNTIKVPDCKTLNFNNNTIQKFYNRKFKRLTNFIIY